MAGPWKCAHCGAQWTARVGPCECGQDSSPGWQASVPKGNDVLATVWPQAPLPTASTPLEEQFSQQRPDVQQQLYQQQKELVALGQQLDQARQEHQRTLQGLQVMLAPLQQWWQQQGRQVAWEQLIPFTVQALAALSQQRVSSTVRAGQGLDAANATPNVTLDGDAFMQAMARLTAAIERLDGRFSAPVEPFPTHVPSEAHLARLEQQAATQATYELPPGWER